MRLKETAVRPSGDFGPVLCLAAFSAAAVCFGVAMTGVWHGPFEWTAWRGAKLLKGWVEKFYEGREQPLVGCTVGERWRTPFCKRRKKGADTVRQQGAVTVRQQVAVTVRQQVADTVRQQGAGAVCQ